MSLTETFSLYATLYGIDLDKYNIYFIKSCKCRKSNYTLHPKILEGLHRSVVT